MINMKRIGIIGGVGAETTAKFYLDIILKSKRLKVNRNPSIVISSVSIPHNIESDFILENRGSERYIPLLFLEAKRLESAEVDFIVMPCNSLHIFIEHIRDSVDVPVLSIVEETVKFILKNNFKKIGLISTSATLENKLYENIFIENNISFISPDKLDQKKIGSIILNLVNGFKINKDKKRNF